MSAAARGAAGYLCLSGRLRGVHGMEVGAEQKRKREEAERAAEELRREREAKERDQLEGSQP